MRTPKVTEMPPRPEPMTPDTFLEAEEPHGNERATRPSTSQPVERPQNG